MRQIMLFVIACYLVSSYSLYSQLETQDEVISKDTEEQLTQWINHKIDSVAQKNNIPALSIGVLHKGKVILKKGVGVLHRDTKQPATENSMYQIASDTKKMTGIIVKNLVNEQKLDLDQPIVVYLGSLLENDAKERLKHVTVRHLLLHTSGLPYRQPTITRKDGEPMLNPYTKALLLNDLNKVTLQSEPGAEFGYSNFGYAIVGYVCELASQQTYAALIQKYISNAYDMTNTTVVLTDKQKELLATPYRKENRNEETSAFTMGTLTAAGGVYSTIHDQIQLMRLQMKTYSKKSDPSNPLMLHKNPFEKENGYSFGLGKKVFDTGIQYGHGGDLDGFGSAYVFSPEYQSGVIILTSSGGKWIGELEKEIFYKLTNRKYVLPKKSIAQEIYDIISTTNYEAGKVWFDQHKNSEKFYLREQEMNNVGYALLNQEKMDDALKVFKLNTELFPDSGNVYDSLGECYLKLGDKEKAAINYKKSLLLDPKNTNAKEMIKKIETDPKN